VNELGGESPNGKPVSDESGLELLESEG